MSHALRRRGIATLVGVLVYALSVPVATADRVDHDSVAAPGTVFFSGDSIPLSAYPRVTRPGHTVIVGVGLLNLSRLPATAWIKFKGWCFTRDHEQVNFGRRPIRVRVPGNPSNPPSSAAQRYLVRTLTLPRNCVHDEFRRDLGLYDGTFYIGAQTRRTAASEYAGTLGNYYIGRPFVHRHVRWNLTLQSGRRGSNYQAHHTLPVRFEERFRRAGLNIHDPMYLRWWCSKPGVPTNHQSNAAEYNRRWERFFRRHPRATKDEILEFRTSLSRQYVYRCPR